eukprot:TRINITY_DN1500_c0_g1_i2.p1 TRINITY_DN1500_c0_g1~~TRINITY_DN1500_c0_g1_i2.p1  ORF type:complete len:451 (+),score=132.91 TRINITY_DN1500_c0_g1_i2:177-1529(+)
MPEHKCPQCASVFSRSSNLKRHIECVHNDIRKFECPHCDKAYKRKRDLDGHLYAVHRQIKPFMCNVPGCEKSFARQEQLRAHARQHTERGCLDAATSPSECKRKVDAVAVPADDVFVPTNSAIGGPTGASADAAASVGNVASLAPGTFESKAKRPRRSSAAAAVSAIQSTVSLLLNDDTGAQVASQPEQAAAAASVTLAPILWSDSATSSTAGCAAQRSQQAAHATADVPPPSPPHRARLASSEQFVLEHPSSPGGLPRVASADRIVGGKARRLLDAAHRNQLVRHDDHIDALIDGRLFSLGDGLNLTEHDVDSVLDRCNNSALGAHHAIVPIEPCRHACSSSHRQRQSSPDVTSHTSLSLAGSPDIDWSTLESHVHGEGCGHERVWHNDHSDFLVGHHLHHVTDHGCEIHGHMERVSVEDLLGEPAEDQGNTKAWRELFAADQLIGGLF